MVIVSSNYLLEFRDQFNQWASGCMHGHPSLDHFPKWVHARVIPCSFWPLAKSPCGQLVLSKVSLFLGVHLYLLPFLLFIFLLTFFFCHEELVPSPDSRPFMVDLIKMGKNREKKTKI